MLSDGGVPAGHFPGADFSAGWRRCDRRLGGVCAPRPGAPAIDIATPNPSISCAIGEMEARAITIATLSLSLSPYLCLLVPLCKHGVSLRAIRGSTVMESLSGISSVVVDKVWSTRQRCCVISPHRMSQPSLSDRNFHQGTPQGKHQTLRGPQLRRQGIRPDASGRFAGEQEHAFAQPRHRTVSERSVLAAYNPDRHIAQFSCFAETDESALLAAVTKREMAQLRRDFDQSLVDRDSNVAIHSLKNNYIAQCRSLVATKAKYGSWSSLYEGTGSHSERNRICESAFREWGFEEMIVYWESLQTLSRELNESKHKNIVRGEGEQLLAVISTSTHFKNYHAAFSHLVRLVESRLS